MAPKQKPGLSKQDYPTPPELITAVCRYLGIESFAFDIAATRGVNNIVPDCFTKADSALTREWPRVGWNWLNPEFGDIGPWVKKAYTEAQDHLVNTVVLVPASMGANWWVEWVEKKANIVPLQGRIAFLGHGTGYPKDCALLIYSINAVPGYMGALKWMDLLTDKEKEMAKKRQAAERPAKRGKVRSIKAGPKKKAAARRDTKKKDTAPQAPGRVTTFKPNGATSMQPAPGPEQLGSDLGPIFLPDPESSQKVLAELAKLNDQAQAAKKVWEEYRDRTKAAKEKYDDLVDMVSTRLRVTTHKSELPLFPDEREADQTRMEAAASAPAPEPASEPVPEPAELVPEPENAPGAPESHDLEVPAGEVAPPAPDAAPAAVPDEELAF